MTSSKLGNCFGCLKLLMIAIAAVLLAPTLASASVTSSIDVMLHSGDDWGTWSVEVPGSSEPYSWQLTSPVDISSAVTPGLLLGTIDSMNLSADPDPFVTLGFAVTAGAAPTVFSITSASVPIIPINNGLAFASAGITATEGGDDLDGATVAGLFPGVKAYEARYNFGGGIFADLVSPVVTPPGGGSTTLSERFPVPIGSRIVIPGVVNEIQSQFNFTLSAFDLASGTSRFDIIVPEPSSLVLGLCGLVGVVMIARRRRG